MKMRIIAGEFGGRLIDAPSGRRMHPMGERIRNAMFNIIGDEIKGADVLDAFAGTGAVGFEALSRGASFVTFIELDRLMQKIIQNNIDLLDVSDRVRQRKLSVSGFINSGDQAFDIIFADPPYHDVQLSTIKKLMVLLKPGGLMVLSHPGKGEVLGLNGIVVVDNRSYGNASLTFYRRESA